MTKTVAEQIEEIAEELVMIDMYQEHGEFVGAGDHFISNGNHYSRWMTELIQYKIASVTDKPALLSELKAIANESEDDLKETIENILEAQQK